MMNKQSDVRRFLVKPLIRRRVSPSERSRIEAAFGILEERAIAESILPDIVAAQKQTQKDRQRNNLKDPEKAKEWIQFAAAMYTARHVTFQEYIFLVEHAVVTVHEGRIEDGAYPELQKISNLMRRAASAHGLASDEYWPIRDAPPEFRRLDNEWNLAAQRGLDQTYEELEGHFAAGLFQNDRKKFMRLCERGRRAFFHKDELIAVLKDTIKRYEREARLSAEAGAFTAAVSLLGAAMEGLLLLRCLGSPSKASRIAKALPRRERPRNPGSPAEWTFNNLIRVCLQAGWLPSINVSTISIRPDGLAHQLREMRNYIHPGNVCTERPWIEVERRDFDDAELIYTTLFATVFETPKLREYANSEPTEGGGQTGPGPL